MKLSVCLYGLLLIIDCPMFNAQMGLQEVCMHHVCTSPTTCDALSGLITIHYKRSPVYFGDSYHYV